MSGAPAHKVMKSWFTTPDGGFVRRCVCGYRTEPHTDGIQARLAIERHVIDSVCDRRSDER